jgi:hypothetical protein
MSPRAYLVDLERCPLEPRVARAGVKAEPKRIGKRRDELADAQPDPEHLPGADPLAHRFDDRLHERELVHRRDMGPDAALST